MLMKINSNRGFTLTELMIVVLIMGILVAVAIPATNAARSKAENNACIQNQQIIHTEAVRFYADHGRYPTDVQELVDGGYLQSMPHCKGALYGEVLDGFVQCPDNSHTESIQ